MRTDNYQVRFKQYVVLAIPNFCQFIYAIRRIAFINSAELSTVSTQYCVPVAPDCMITLIREDDSATTFAAY